MKVCVFGDSISKGVVFDNEKNRYTLLRESFINMIQNKTDVEINNVSCFGCTVSKGIGLLEKVEGELKDYEFTFIEYGGNDCDYNWAEVAENPDFDHQCKTPLSAFKEKYGQMIEKIKKLGSNPVLVTLPPIDSKRFFDWVSKGLNKDNILKFLGDVNHIGRWQSLYNDTVKQLSILYKLPVLDIRSIFLKQNNIMDFICDDGIHPNYYGHKLIYQAIANSTWRRLQNGKIHVLST